MIHFVVYFINVQTNKHKFGHCYTLSQLLYYSSWINSDHFISSLLHNSTWIPFIGISLLLYFLSSMHKYVQLPTMGWGFLYILFMYVYVIFMCTDVFLSLFRCDSIHINFRTINSILYLLLSPVSSWTKAPIVATATKYHFRQHLKCNEKSQWNHIFHFFQRREKYCHNISNCKVKAPCYILAWIFGIWIELHSMCTMYNGLLYMKWTFPLFVN